MKILIFVILFFSCEVFASPKRIITLSPALTELVFALNLGDRIVGVSEFSDFPEEAKKIQSVGPYTQPSIEKILSLKTDLVFLPQEGPEDIKKHFDQLHINYKIISMRTLDQIGGAALEVSDTLDDHKVGLSFKTKWDSDLKSLFPKNTTKHSKVLIEVQKDPLIVAGSKTFLDEIVTKCGGKNIIETEGYPKVSMEVPISQKIDVILLADYFKTKVEREEAISFWRAKNKKNIYVLDNDTTARPGPRLISGIKSICSILKEKNAN